MSLISEFMPDPEARTIEAIRHEIARLEYASAAARMFARARCNEPLPIDLVCEVIPRLDTVPMLLMLLRLAEGDRVGAIVTLLETDAFPSDPVGMQAAWAFAVVANQLGATSEQRQRLAAAIRLTACACLEQQPPSSIRAKIISGFRFAAGQLDDSVLAAMLPVDLPGTGSGEIQLAVTLLPHLSREELLAIPTREEAMPFEPIARQLGAAIGFEPRLARNQICWCGSAKKFKRCHGSGSTPTVPPPNPRSLSVTETQTRPLREFVTMRLDHLGDSQLATVIDRLIKYQVWELAERALSIFEKRDHLAQEARDQVRDILIGRAIRSRQWDLASKHAQKLRSPRFAKYKEALAAVLPIVERGPHALDHLVAFADAAVRDSDGSIDGIGVILQTMPALAVVLLRATVAASLEPTADVFSAITQCRARLGLPAGDPSETVHTQWQAAKARAREVDAQGKLLAEAKADADALRGTIADAHRENRDLARRVEDLERQLRERPVALPPVETPAEPAELRALRAKIDQLQEIVRDKNLELAELRREHRASRTDEQDPTGNPRRFDPRGRQ